MGTVVARGSAAMVAGMLISCAGLARAQAQRPGGSGPETLPPSSTQLAAPGTSPPLTGSPSAPRELVEAHPGGLTSDEVGARASATSWSAKAGEENLRGAAARVDEAWGAFLPRLSGVAKYTHLSDFTPPVIAFGPAGYNAVYVKTGTPARNVTTADLFAPQSAGAGFPVITENWLLQGTITVPISDYFFRIDQNYSAATRSREAAHWDLVALRATAASNGRAAYYTWLRARGAVVVAVLALEDQKTHLRDGQNQFTVGNASKADVLRAETAVASAELALEQAKNLADLSEKQVRVAIHANDDATLLPAEDLEAPLGAPPGDLKQMSAKALSDRAEVKSADANAAAARDLFSAAKAGRYPVLSAFGDGILANPNTRVFPQSDAWFPTWDIGAQVTWSPNDVFVAGGAIADAASRVAAIEANKNNVRDGIAIEVTQTYQNVHQADFAIVTSTRELASAQEAYRVARELFINGRGTSTTLTDAETDLTRARLDLLNAKADARIARIRLDHAVGLDASGAVASGR